MLCTLFLVGTQESTKWPRNVVPYTVGSNFTGKEKSIEKEIERERERERERESERERERAKQGRANWAIQEQLRRQLE